jgi:hypothetical protein
MLSHGNSRRRVVISLAALVDLLFVAMFLEFVELQRVAAEQNQAKEIAEQLAADANNSKAEAEREKEKAKQAEADALRFRNEVLDTKESLVKERDRLAAEIESLRTENKRLDDRATTLASDLDGEKDRAAANERALGEAVRDMLGGVDIAVVKDALRGADNDQVAQIVSELREAQGKNVGQVIQSLRKAAELRKRCDVWETHIYFNGSIRVRTPEGLEERFKPTSADNCASRLNAVTKKTAVPKPLVVILLTYESCTLEDFEIANEGLELFRRAWTGHPTQTFSVQVSQPNYSESAP